MLAGVSVRLGTDYFDNKEEFSALAKKVVYTGPIDRYFDYCFGPLAYRSVRFETFVVDTPDYQGNAVVNYTDRETPYTRIIEHKHFEKTECEKSVISKEYSAEWTLGDEPYYPVNDGENSELYKKYKDLAEKESAVIFGGRLGTYRYLDMHHIVAEALAKSKEEIEK